MVVSDFFVAVFHLRRNFCAIHTCEYEIPGETITAPPNIGRQCQCNRKTMLGAPLQRINQVLQFKSGIIKGNLVPEVPLYPTPNFSYHLAVPAESFSLERIRVLTEKPASGRLILISWLVILVMIGSQR